MTLHPGREDTSNSRSQRRVNENALNVGEVTPELTHWRRHVDFLPCAETPIRPLLEELDFIEDKARWGYRFRSGVFQIDEHDFTVLRSAMTDKSSR